MSQKSGNQKQAFEPVPEPNNEVAELKAQMAAMQRMMQDQMQVMSANNAHPQSQQGGAKQMQPIQHQAQPVPQQQAQPQLSQIPALQGVGTYIAIHPSGLGVQTYLFDSNLMQWRAPTQHESENMVQLFGIPRNVIDAMKNFRF